MPEVKTKKGTKHFPYTPEGMKKAEAAAKKAGGKVKMGKMGGGKGRY